MTNNVLNKKVIAELKTYIPQNKLADQLSDILDLEKASIYRRLRGEVDFSLIEVVKIAQTLHFSVDKIIGEQTDKIVFDLYTIDNDSNSKGYYYEFSKELADYFSAPTALVNSLLKVAYNTIPCSFFLKYPLLSRLFLFIYRNETNKDYMPVPLSEVIIPDETRAQNMKRHRLFREINVSEYIFDRNMFPSVIRSITYFAGLNLISVEDLLTLKKELLDMISELETLSAVGCFSNGNKVSIYLSNIDFDFPYSYFKSDLLEYCRFKIYGLNYLSSHNAVICERQKNWIDSLKKYAVLITQSNEMERFKYFNNQRAGIERELDAIINGVGSTTLK
jgi:hypothetical protein